MWPSLSPNPDFVSPASLPLLSEPTLHRAHTLCISQTGYSSESTHSRQLPPPTPSIPYPLSSSTYRSSPSFPPGFSAFLFPVTVFFFFPLSSLSWSASWYYTHFLLNISQLILSLGSIFVIRNKYFCTSHAGSLNCCGKTSHPRKSNICGANISQIYTHLPL